MKIMMIFNTNISKVGKKSDSVRSCLRACRKPQACAAQTETTNEKTLDEKNTWCGYIFE